MITLNQVLSQVFGKTTAAQRYAIRLELLKMIAGRPTEPESGLCLGVEDAAESVGYDPVEPYSLFRSWDHFSGSIIYPLPGWRTAYFEHLEAGALWTDPEQLRLRKSLALHVLNCLDQYISNLSR